jgi:hypothetical protein
MGHQLLAREASVGRDPAGVEPVRGLGEGGPGRGREPLDALEGVVVAVGDGLLLREERGQLFELRHPHGRRDVREAVVVADLVVPVLGARQASLGRQVFGPLRQRWVVRRQHATTTGGDDLVAVERITTNLTNRADVFARERPAAETRTERLGGIFDQKDAIPFAGFGDGGELRRVAEDVDDLDRLGHRQALALAAIELRDDLVGGKIPRGELGVDEGERAALVRDGARRGDEGHRRAEDFVAPLDAREPHGDVQGGGATGAGDGVFGPHVGRELALEALDERTDRGDEIRPQTFVQIGALVASEERLGQRHEGRFRHGGTRCCSGRAKPATSRRSAAGRRGARPSAPSRALLSRTPDRTTRS